MGRRIRIGPHHNALMKNAVKLKDDKFRNLLSRRKCTVEPVFGVIKECMGFRRYSGRNRKCPRPVVSRLHSIQFEEVDKILERWKSRLNS